MDLQIDEKNLYWQGSYVTAKQRLNITKSKGTVLWLTGLSGSGKSTIAISLEKALIESGRMAVCLDGDHIRKTICSDIGFSEKDRTENIRRVACISNLFCEASIITLVSVISPLRAMREIARDIIGAENFTEVFVHADIEICKIRDPKGLYKRAAEGKIQSLTGVSSPYEAPQSPDILLDTSKNSVETCTQTLFDFLIDKKKIQ